MKKSTIIIILLVVVSASAFNCNKDKDRIEGCLKGRIIDALCASYIVQITDGNYDPSRVIDTWQDPQTGNTYTNVFAVSNICDLQGKLAAGDEFNFYFSDIILPMPCTTCLAIRPVPQKSNTIRLTTSCNN